MLSRSEIDFLKGKKSVSPNYARYLKHSIKQKIQQFKTLIPILMENSYTRSLLMEAVGEISNIVRKNPNTHQEIPTENQNQAFQGEDSKKPAVSYMAGPGVLIPK